jgi:hypothetical protein
MFDRGFDDPDLSLPASVRPKSSPRPSGEPAARDLLSVAGPWPAPKVRSSSRITSVARHWLTRSLNTHRSAQVVQDGSAVGPGNSRSPGPLERRMPAVPSAGTDAVTDADRAEPPMPRSGPTIHCREENVMISIRPRPAPPAKMAGGSIAWITCCAQLPHRRAHRRHEQTAIGCSRPS